MFNLNFNIHNFWKKEVPVTELFGKNFSVSQNKSIEIESSTGSFDDIFDFRLNLSPLGGRDHAGFSLHVIIGNFSGGITFYDKRHWNYDKNEFLQNQVEWTKEVLELLTNEFPDKQFFEYEFWDEYEEGFTPNEVLEKYKRT